MNSSLISVAVNWAKVGLVLGIIAALAIIFSVLILLVTKFFHMKEDDKVLQILSNLAGANCGGCGFSGCEGFAKCLAEGNGNLNDCKVTSAEKMEEVARICGVEFSKEEQTVAAVLCAGGDLAKDKYTYVGNEGCLNQKVILGGKKLCANGCLAGASCNLICHVDAIKMENGVAVIDKAACTSCGACIAQCPQNCIGRIPATAPIYIACSAACNGKTTAGFCKAGCIKCGLCVRVCKKGAITMEKDKLPIIDYSKCNGCKTCVAKCPRKIIKEH